MLCFKTKLDAEPEPEPVIIPIHTTSSIITDANQPTCIKTKVTIIF